MLERPLYQPAMFQDSRRRHAICAPLVLGLHALVAIVLVLGLASKVRTQADAENPVMATLSPSSAPDQLPAPIPADISVRNPKVQAPTIAIAPETPETVTTPLAATPNESVSQMVASIAPASAGDGSSGAAQGAAGTGGAGGVDISAYLARVSQHIQRYIPRTMPRRVQNGSTVRVYLRWNKDGTVTAFRLIKSAEVDWANDAAMTAIQRANPLPPIPPEYRMNMIQGTLPVLFQRY